MGELNFGTIYDFNKIIIKQTNPCSQKETDKIFSSIVKSYFEKQNNKYFMLLCKELNDYTVFNINTKNPDKVAQELKECCDNRGKLYSLEITADNIALEIWLKINEEPTCYLLFPYDEGVIEI